MGWVTAKIAVGAFLILAGLSYLVTGFVAAYEGGIWMVNVTDFDALGRRVMGFLGVSTGALWLCHLYIERLEAR